MWHKCILVFLPYEECLQGIVGLFECRHCVAVYSVYLRTYSELQVQWRYQNDAMEWCSYTEEASAKIEDMRQRGVASFSLDKQLCNCNKAYLIYLEDMMQASPRSGTKRLIERVTTKLPARKQTATSDMATPLTTCKCS